MAISEEEGYRGTERCGIESLVREVTDSRFKFRSRLRHTYEIGEPEALR